MVCTVIFAGFKCSHFANQQPSVKVLAMKNLCINEYVFSTMASQIDSVMHRENGDYVLYIVW